jgi:hypothetical protein
LANVDFEKHSRLNAKFLSQCVKRRPSNENYRHFRFGFDREHPPPAIGARQRIRRRTLLFFSAPFLRALRPLLRRRRQKFLAQPVVLRTGAAVFLGRDFSEQRLHGIRDKAVDQSHHRFEPEILFNPGLAFCGQSKGESQFAELLDSATGG